jgi:hypothetical protein
VRRAFGGGVALLGGFLKLLDPVDQFSLLGLQLFDQFSLRVHDRSELIEIVLEVGDLGFEFDDSLGVGHAVSRRVSGNKGWSGKILLPPGKLSSLI